MLNPKRSHKHDMEKGLRGLLENAMDLADSLVAQAPDRHISAEEFAHVEGFVVTTILNEARAELERKGASAVAHAMAEGPVAEMFKRMFAERFQMQSKLMMAKTGGCA